MFERFTEKSIKIIMLAQEEAHRLGHNFVGTEQILLGLLREPGTPAQILNSVGVNLKESRKEVEKIIGRGSGFDSPEIPFTPRAKHVLELSWELAKQFRHNYISPEHLLLGILEEAANTKQNGPGVAAQVLESLGVNLKDLYQKTYQETFKLISPSPRTRPADLGELAFTSSQVQFALDALDKMYKDFEKIGTLLQLTPPSSDAHESLTQTREKLKEFEEEITKLQHYSAELHTKIDKLLDRKP